MSTRQRIAMEKEDFISRYYSRFHYRNDLYDRKGEPRGKKTSGNYQISFV